MCKNYLGLKIDADPGDVVIRYKDFVLAARLMPGTRGCYFVVEAFWPVETEEEAGVDFQDLRLEPVGGWDRVQFDTEGEALLAGMQTLDFMVEGGEFE